LKNNGLSKSLENYNNSILVILIFEVSKYSTPIQTKRGQWSFVVLSTHEKRWGYANNFQKQKLFLLWHINLFSFTLDTPQTSKASNIIVTIQIGTTDVNQRDSRITAPHDE